MSRSKRYTDDVLRSVKENHIWLNAFHCIRPTPEFKMQLGARILEWLASNGNTIESDFDGTAFEDLHGRELIVRINKS